MSRNRESRSEKKRKKSRGEGSLFNGAFVRNCRVVVVVAKVLMAMVVVVAVRGLQVLAADSSKHLLSLTDARGPGTSSRRPQLLLRETRPRGCEVQRSCEKNEKVGRDPKPSHLQGGPATR